MMESTYPRTYKFGPWALLMYSACSLLFVAAGAGFAIWLELAATVRTWNLALELCICLPIVLFGRFTWVSVFRCKLVLYADHLVYHEVLRARTIYRSDIVTTRGVRVVYGNLSVVLILKHARKKALRIAAFGSGDDAFADWFEDLPNEEGEAEERTNEALLANPAFGSNPTEREQTINRDASLLNRLRWPAYGIALWGFIYPSPYNICLYTLAVVPAVAALLVFISRGKWLLNDDNTSGRLGIGGVIAVGPAIVVGLRAFLDDHVVDWRIPAAWGVASAVVLMLFVALIERRPLRPVKLATVSLAYFAYAWGALMFVDTSLDPSKGMPNQVQILSTNADKDGATFRVTHWASHGDDNEVSVSRSLYHRFRPRDTVCIFVYPGRLGWPWYEVDACSAAKK